MVKFDFQNNKYFLQLFAPISWVKYLKLAQKLKLTPSSGWELFIHILKLYLEYLDAHKMRGKANISFWNISTQIREPFKNYLADFFP